MVGRRISALGAVAFALLCIVRPAVALYALDGAIDNVDRPRALSVAGGLVYLAEGEAGLRIIDVAAPEAPVLRGRVATSGSAEGLTLSAGVAYVADYKAGLSVIDVSDPDAPVELGSLAGLGSAYGTGGWASPTKVPTALLSFRQDQI